MYSWIDPIPIGSASIAQIHRATTREGDSVILKVVKPGIRETLTRDAILLRVARGVPADLPGALPAEAGHRRVRGVHPARGRPAPRGRQRRDLRRQLPRPAGRCLPAHLPPVQRPQRALHGVPPGLQAERARGPAAHRRGARPPGRPWRREHHPHALPGRLLPRRPPPGQPADPPRPAARVHRPRHGGPLRRGAAADDALLLLLAGHGRRRGRGALPRRHRPARPGRRSGRVPPRGHRDPAALAPRRAASATSRSPSSSCARSTWAPSTGCTSRSRWSSWSRRW